MIQNREHARRTRAARGPLWLMTLVAAVGVVIGAASYPVWAEEGECETILTVEGFGAQDTNLDGVATIAEGMIDIDGDGLFGDAEAAANNMNCYICWENVTVCGSVAVAGSYTPRPNHMCVYNHRTLVSWCKSYNFQDCKDYGSSCKAGK